MDEYEPKPLPTKRHKEPSIDLGDIEVPPLIVGEPVGWLLRSRDFFARQYSTKTGKGAIGTIAGAIGAIIAGTLTTGEAVTPIVMAVLAMLLRDGQAKKEQAQKRKL